MKSKPELHGDIMWLAQVLATKHAFELLRFQLLGRNSSTERFPHPHSSCGASIRNTGKAETFPVEFQEGQGHARPQV